MSQTWYTGDWPQVGPAGVSNAMFATKLKAGLTPLVMFGLGAFGDGMLPARMEEPPAKPDNRLNESFDAALLKKKVEAAEATHNGAWESLGTVRRLGEFIAPVITPEQVYWWSIRWLNAKLDLSNKAVERIAAWEAHVKRMKELFNRVKAMTPELLPRWNKSAAIWYLAEAEIGLARERHEGVEQVLIKTQIEASEEAYKAAREIFCATKKINDVEMPEGSHAEVYYWSSRWLGCQLGSSDKPPERTSALAAHVKRMEELAVKVSAMTPKLRYMYERPAASWYLTEARIRLAKEKREQPGALLKERLDEAKEAFTGESRMYQVIKLSSAWQIENDHPEKVYQYSVRWLNAQSGMIEKREDRVAAYEEHVQRMKDLQKKVIRLTDYIPKWWNSAAEWYLAEAELWLAREKAK
jgi:hypothetical protein